ncbi:unnamed protein product [Phyllotreta striolata]|uniref:UBZ1-type domain-containing protein n=1 Tax=Phyllotreta striolata TaxID=444603 RepID=A0A9N9XR02_PHYSR|nr:unnamed protein product [Phyllotreta striolata]
MDESVGAHYAIQIAVQTLRDRCKALQKRVGLLEEENIILRTACSKNEETERSLTELDILKGQISEITEQRDQLQERVKMVTNENQDLWTKLGKLISVNKNLNEQFNKINETLNRHTNPPTLIRSKTFTQNNPLLKHSPQKSNLEVNENLSLELENISLKLMDSFSKQKLELEKMCSEITEMQCDDEIITENYGFCFDESMEDDVNEECNGVLENLKALREEVLLQKMALTKSVTQLECLASIKTIPCKLCDKRNKSRVEKTTSTDDIPKIGMDKCTETNHSPQGEDSSVKTSSLAPENIEKICPICSQLFKKEVKFEEFLNHVEGHFMFDGSDFENVFIKSASESSFVD